MREEKLAEEKLTDRAQDILDEMWLEVADRDGFLSFRVLSGSMSPAIRAGDVVKVVKITPENLRVGDIVAFRDGENTLVHRFIGIDRSGHPPRYRQMGDTGTVPGCFPAGSLIGRVTGIQKNDGELNLETRKSIIISYLLAWRLRYIAYATRNRYRVVNRGLRFLRRPLGFISRRLLARDSG